MKLRTKILLIGSVIVIAGCSIGYITYLADKTLKGIEINIEQRNKEMIKYDHEEAEELSNLVDQMYEEIAEEQTWEQAWLDASTQVRAEDVKALGNVIYNEVRNIDKLDMSCVAWTVLNRADKDNKSVVEVVSKPKQFAYRPDMQLKSDKAKAILKDCEDMARDVMTRWYMEKAGIEEVGRTLPNNYFSFWGDGKTTHFRTNVGVYEYWDFSLGNPYEGM